MAAGIPREEPPPDCISDSGRTTRWCPPVSAVTSTSQAVAAVAVAGVGVASWAANPPAPASSRGRSVWSDVAARAPSAAATSSTTATCWRPRTAWGANHPPRFRCCWETSGSASLTPARDATRSSGSSLTRGTGAPRAAAGTLRCWGWRAGSLSAGPFLPSVCLIVAGRTPASGPSPPATVGPELPGRNLTDFYMWIYVSGVRGAALEGGVICDHPWSAPAAIQGAAGRSAWATAAARWWHRFVESTTWSVSPPSAGPAHAGWPDVFARVTSALSWIAANTRDAATCRP